MLYRIFTEDKPGTTEIAAKYFRSFTVYSAQGYWGGIAEPAIIIEIDTLVEDGREWVKLLAAEIKRVNKQDAVLVQEIQAVSHLV